MRVLIYIEPHPIRQSLTHFGDVLRKLLPILKDKRGVDIRVFANDATFTYTGDVDFDGQKVRFLRSQPEEEQLFAAYQALAWDNDGIRVWQDLISGRGEVTAAYLTLLRRLWHAFPFDVLVHWGENGAISRLVEERPVSRVAMELGCTRSPFFESLVMDPYGTNGSGLVPRLNTDQVAKIVGGRPMSADEALQSVSAEVSKNIYCRQYEPLPDLIAQSRNQPMAFLPLQLFDDANLLQFSPFETVTDVVQNVVPRLVEAGYAVVIKPHPASKQRKGSAAANNLALASLRPWSNKVIWCDGSLDVSNIRLISRCDLVVTVNSSVGFESLFLDKPVVVLGEAVYKPAGLFPTLAAFLDDRVDWKEYQFNIGILRKFFLGGYLVPEAICEDANAFADRLALIQGLHGMSAHDPFQYAESYWRACSPAQLASCRSLMLFGGLTSADAGARAASPGADARTQEEVLSSVVHHIRLLWCEERVISTLAWMEHLAATEEGRRKLLVSARFYGAASGSDADAAEAEKAYALVSSMGLQELVEWLAAAAPVVPGTVEPSTAQRFRYLVEACTGPDGPESFVRWLSASWGDAAARGKILRHARIVDPEYYLNTHTDVRQSGVDPVEHYCSYGIREGRSPAQGVPVQTPEALLHSITSVIDKSALAPDSAGRGVSPEPLEPAQARSRILQLQAIGEQLGGSGNRIAVVAHLYYSDLVPEVIARLTAIPEPFDLIVTLPDFGNERTIRRVREAFPDALFYVAANRGRDVAPFLDVLPSLKEKGYDAVLKIQTKRGFYDHARLIGEFGTAWREDSFNALLGSEDRVRDIISAFRERDGLSMVGPEPFLVSLRKYPYHDSGALADRCFPGEDPSDGSFFAGTMFWVRPSSLKALGSLNLLDFAPETGSNDGALAHLVERAFGQAAGSQGGQIAAAPVDAALPLHFDPQPRETSLDGYFSARASGRFTTPRLALG